MDKLEKAIERRREELNMLLDNTNCYNEGKALEVSQKLDKLIYEHMEYSYKQSV